MSIVMQFIVRMSGVLMSGMPNKACPFPGTIKKVRGDKYFVFVIVLYFYFTYVLLCYCSVVS